MSNHNGSPVIPLKEFDQEMTITRRLLERLPDDQDDFKPHERSMAFGYLSQMVAAIPGWIDATLRQDSIDLAEQSEDGDGSGTDLLAQFDRNVEKAREALQRITGDKLEEDWSLTMRGKTLMTLPRGEAARNHLSHLIHHRGQLSVYERMLDVKVPQIYGPSADAPWGAPA